MRYSVDIDKIEPYMLLRTWGTWSRSGNDFLGYKKLNIISKYVVKNDVYYLSDDEYRTLDSVLLWYKNNKAGEYKLLELYFYYRYTLSQIAKMIRKRKVFVSDTIFYIVHDVKSMYQERLQNNNSK